MIQILVFSYLFFSSCIFLIFFSLLFSSQLHCIALRCVALCCAVLCALLIVIIFFVSIVYDVYMLLQVNPLSPCNHLRKQHPSVNDGHKLVSLNVSNRSSPFKSTIPIIPILFGFIVVAVVGVRTIGIVATVARG